MIWRGSGLVRGVSSVRKLVGLVLLTVLGPAVAGETGTRIGRAVSLESEMSLYAEHHEETREGEKVVSATVRQPL